MGLLFLILMKPPRVRVCPHPHSTKSPSEEVLHVLSGRTSFYSKSEIWKIDEQTRLVISVFESSPLRGSLLTGVVGAVLSLGPAKQMHNSASLSSRPP